MASHETFCVRWLPLRDSDARAVADQMVEAVEQCYQCAHPDLRLAGAVGDLSALRSLAQSLSERCAEIDRLTESETHECPCQVDGRQCSLRWASKHARRFLTSLGTEVISSPPTVQFPAQSSSSIPWTSVQTQPTDNMSSLSAKGVTSHYSHWEPITQVALKEVSGSTAAVGCTPLRFVLDDNQMQELLRRRAMKSMNTPSPPTSATSSTAVEGLRYELKP